MGAFAREKGVEIGGGGRACALLQRMPAPAPFKQKRLTSAPRGVWSTPPRPRVRRGVTTACTSANDPPTATAKAVLCAAAVRPALSLSAASAAATPATRALARPDRLP